MNHYKSNLEKLCLENDYFRKVLFTSDHQQLVLMSVTDEIGMEVHKHNDQFIQIHQGRGTAIINNQKHNLKPGDCVLIPRNSYHNIVNSSKNQPLKLVTIYSPPHHEPYARQKYREIEK